MFTAVACHPLPDTSRVGKIQNANYTNTQIPNTQIPNYTITQLHNYTNTKYINTKIIACHPLPDTPRVGKIQNANYKDKFQKYKYKILKHKTKRQISKRWRPALSQRYQLKKTLLKRAAGHLWSNYSTITMSIDQYSLLFLDTQVSVA